MKRFARLVRPTVWLLAGALLGAVAAGWWFHDFWPGERPRAEAAYHARLAYADRSARTATADPQSAELTLAAEMRIPVAGRLVRVAQQRNPATETLALDSRPLASILNDAADA